MLMISSGEPLFMFRPFSYCLDTYQSAVSKVQRQAAEEYIRGGVFPNVSFFLPTTQHGRRLDYRMCKRNDCVK